MNGAKISHSKFGTVETIKLCHMLFQHHGHHGCYASIQSSSFNSRFWVYYEVKQSSNYEFVKKPVESCLNVCSMLQD